MRASELAPRSLSLHLAASITMHEQHDSEGHLAANRILIRFYGKRKQWRRPYEHWLLGSTTGPQS